MQRGALLLLSILTLVASNSARCLVSAPSSLYSSPQAAPKMHEVTGPFDVKIKPEPTSEVAAPANLGRMSIDKQFHGSLNGTSKGEMLSVLDKEKGSGGYVALERVIGTIDGKSGSFVLQHSATMDRGKPALTITIVPDSGTGELTGITGFMKIDIVDGKHFYTFDYTL